MYDLYTELRSRLKEVTCPLFTLHGTEDKLCDPSGSQMIYDNASSVHKQIKVRTFLQQFSSPHTVVYFTE